SAKVQITRIAKAREVEPQQLETLISQNTDGRFLGIFGEPGVNVLKLNLAVDKISK
ncbi:potassium-transporting ATPase subunit C, partial [Dolichospermum sp. ST_sed9]|nr:potassium-transporting ATPase subunit C [Dolichospermum sp. ST_sed9]